MLILAHWKNSGFPAHFATFSNFPCGGNGVWSKSKLCISRRTQLYQKLTISKDCLDSKPDPSKSLISTTTTLGQRDHAPTVATTSLSVPDYLQGC
jgi:hypothetical protein